MQKNASGVGSAHLANESVAVVGLLVVEHGVEGDGHAVPGRVVDPVHQRDAHFRLLFHPRDCCCCCCTVFVLVATSLQRVARTSAQLPELRSRRRSSRALAYTAALGDRRARFSLRR